MSDESADKAVDIFGIKPGMKAIEIATEKSLDGVGAFLARICLPGAEELGLYARDVVRGWRADNLLAIERRAAQKYAAQHGLNSTGAHAHPRLVSKIVDVGSWEDDAEVQDLWAGLISSSCTKDGKDQSNLLYIGLLSRMTPTQAKLINVFVNRCVKRATSFGVAIADGFEMSISELHGIAPSVPIEQVDAELDSLRDLGFLGQNSGINVSLARVQIDVSSLALNFSVRTQGSSSGPVAFYNLVVPETGV